MFDNPIDALTARVADFDRQIDAAVIAGKPTTRLEESKAAVERERAALVQAAADKAQEALEAENAQIEALAEAETEDRITRIATVLPEIRIASHASSREHIKAASVAHQRATTALAKAATALELTRTEKEGIASRIAEADAAILRIDDRMIEGKEEPRDDEARLKNEHLKLRLSRLLEKAQAEVTAAKRAVDAAAATRQAAYNDLMRAEEEERYAGATEQAVALEAILIERLRSLEIIEKGQRVRISRPYIGGHGSVRCCSPGKSGTRFWLKSWIRARSGTTTSDVSGSRADVLDLECGRGQRDRNPQAPAGASAFAGDEPPAPPPDATTRRAGRHGQRRGSDPLEPRSTPTSRPMTFGVFVLSIGILCLLIVVERLRTGLRPARARAEELASGLLL